MKILGNGGALVLCLALLGVPLSDRKFCGKLGKERGGEGTQRHRGLSLAFRRLTKQLGDSKHMCTLVKMSQLIHQYAFESGSN